MSPILVRPVREQLEHDRVIRLLQVKLKRKNEVTANIGEDQSTPVKVGQMQIYPDLVLVSADRGHKLMCTVEVETSESVNHLEARAQWAHLGRARAPFHLYVPASSADIARRLATENQVNVSELWSYHTIGDQTHFKLVQRTTVPAQRSAASEPRAAAAKPAPRTRPAVKERAASSGEKKRVPGRTAKKRPVAPTRRAGSAPSRGTASARTRPAAKPAAATQKRK